MRKYNLLLVVLLAVLFAVIHIGCGGGEHQDRIAVGAVNYGGKFRFNETEPYSTLYPQKITDIISTHIASQIYEGLLKFDPQTLAIKPSIAEKWEIDPTGKIYTFHLKKGVYFPPSAYEACFLSTRHEKKELEFTLCGTREAFKHIQKG